MHFAIIAGDAAAFRAIIEDRFSMHHGRVLVAESAPASIFDRTDGVSLRGADLGTNVTLVESPGWTVDFLR